MRILSFSLFSSNYFVYIIEDKKNLKIFLHKRARKRFLPAEAARETR